MTYRRHLCHKTSLFKLIWLFSMLIYHCSLKSTIWKHWFTVYKCTKRRYLTYFIYCNLFLSLYYFFSLLLSLFSSLCWALYDMWALTMMSSFTHQRSEASLTEREGPPKHSLSHLPHSLSIIDMQLSVEKPARLSVDLFDEYFSWQTGHLTLCTKAMCG